MPTCTFNSGWLAGSVGRRACCIGRMTQQCSSLDRPLVGIDTREMATKNAFGATDLAALQQAKEHLKRFRAARAPAQLPPINEAELGLVAAAIAGEPVKITRA